MISQHQALLQAILDAPAEDAPRLIYADWLEENGDPDRAEFIRVQYELAQVDDEIVTLGKCQCLPDPTVPCPRCREGKRRDLWWQRDKLRQRVAILLSNPCADFAYQSNAFRWLEPLTSAGILLGVSWLDVAVFRRGFIQSVACPKDDWIRHGPAIVRQHPVERVTLSDVEPAWAMSELTGTEGYWWAFYSTDPGDLAGLPPELYAVWLKTESRFIWWPTKTAALSPLSDACLQWAKAATAQNATV